MIHLVHLLASPSSALIVAMLLLLLVVVLQMRRMRKSKHTILKLTREINRLESENRRLAEQLALQNQHPSVGQMQTADAKQANSDLEPNVELDAEPNADAEDSSAEVISVAEQSAGAISELGELAVEGEKLLGNDEDLLNRFISLIDQNIGDINLSIDDIASEMCMSRSNLFRKVKQITGVGPNEYIRVVRLRRAAKLLQEHRYSIADICMLVGFNSPSYFSSCFKKHYGCLPKDYK